MSEVLEFSDKATGALFASIGLVLGVYFLVFGNIPARYSTRMVLFSANFLGTVGYILIITIKIQAIQIASMLTFVMIAVSINIPTTKLAVKNYTVA